MYSKHFDFINFYLFSNYAMDDEQVTSTTPPPGHYNNQHGAVAVAPTILRFVISPQLITDLTVTNELTSFHELLV